MVEARTAVAGLDERCFIARLTRTSAIQADAGRIAGRPSSVGDSDAPRIDDRRAKAS